MLSPHIILLGHQCQKPFLELFSISSTCRGNSKNWTQLLPSLPFLHTFRVNLTDVKKKKKKKKKKEELMLKNREHGDIFCISNLRILL